MSFPTVPTVGSGAINVDSDDDDDFAPPPRSTSAAVASSPTRPSWSVFQRKPRPAAPVVTSAAAAAPTTEPQPAVAGGVMDDYYKDDDDDEDIHGYDKRHVAAVGGAAAAATAAAAAVPMSNTMEDIIHGGNDIYDATDVLNQLEEEGNNNIPMNDTLVEEYEIHGKTIAANDKEDELRSSTASMMTSSTYSPPTGIRQYVRQLFVLMYYKNISLLLRQPIYILLLVLSNTVSVLLSWPAGRDPDADTAIFIPVSNLTMCHTLPNDVFDTISPNRTSDVQLSYNENFRDGVPVTILALGPLFFSIITYLILHDEISIHMFNILRQIGVYDSCYWLSWYIPLCALGLVNSFLATCVAKLLPVHVYESTYFMGIVGSLFFLHIALIGCSMFLATVQGLRKRFVVFFLVIMILAVWMPVLTMNVQSSFEINPGAVVSGYSDIFSPTKLFWLYRQTEVRIDASIYNIDSTNQTSTYDICNIPIISQQESLNYKTPEQRASVSPDQFFTGCYVTAGWGSTSWSSTRKLNVGTAIWWFFPYYHFLTIWGNFCGYTAYDPNLEFQAEHMTMTAGQLARDAMSIPLNSTGSTPTLFPQGSMIQHESSYISKCDYGGCPEYLSNCPANDYNNGAYDLCESLNYMDNCPRALDPSPAEGKSVYFMFLMLTAVSFTYMLMAAYWGIVFLGGAGTYPMYFFVLPSYWFGMKQPSKASTNNVKYSQENSGSNNHLDANDADGVLAPHSTRTGATEDSVKVMNVSKSYGNVQALQPVTFEMARGEVTALLGHNGAGTFSYRFISVLCFLHIMTTHAIFLSTPFCDTTKLPQKVKRVSDTMM